MDSGYVGRQILAPLSDAMVASPAHIAARGSPSTLQDLVSHDCVISARPSGHATWRFAGPNGEKEVQVTGRFSGNTARALRKATVAGLGIALLAPAMAKLDVQAGVLVPVLPQYRRTGHGMSVLYPSRRHLPLAVSAFIGLVIQKMNAADAPEVHRSVRRR
ncbi:substrate binding domain-containing protein [Collimonas sp.]|jgi:DNA-binding transcriptional LysR family regulator|uniref:substrate binding domain-containing protein n=1 Tax=Collimonas sp. TaxID=1963772 RepID=UPI002BC3EB7E|nr:substrate binding domain-containing protein [Collimonas sp.]HWW04499.1 substrate binding domain-containing protein [Collimonas sp.]